MHTEWKPLFQNTLRNELFPPLTSNTGRFTEFAIKTKFPPKVGSLALKLGLHCNYDNPLVSPGPLWATSPRPAVQVPSALLSTPRPLISPQFSRAALLALCWCLFWCLRGQTVISFLCWLYLFAWVNTFGCVFLWTVDVLHAVNSHPFNFFILHHDSCFFLLLAYAWFYTAIHTITGLQQLPKVLRGKAKAERENVFSRFLWREPNG